MRAVLSRVRPGLLVGVRAQEERLASRFPDGGGGAGPEEGLALAVARADLVAGWGRPRVTGLGHKGSVTRDPRWVRRVKG